MSKRAVSFSYALVRDFICGNKKIEKFHVTNSVPDNAVLIEMVPHPESGSISLIFESNSWEGEPMDIYINAPKSGKVMCHPYCVHRFLKSELSENG